MKVLEECIGNAVIKFKPLSEVAALHVRFFFIVTLYVRATIHISK